MKPVGPPCTHEELKRLMTYDQYSGLFTRHFKRTNKLIRGSPHHDYVMVKLYERCVGAHQLAWFYVHGKWADEHVDHINGDKKDNRIANLRAVSSRTNLQNSFKLPKHSSSGFRGVTFAKDQGPHGRWKAQIMAAGKRYHLGYFATAADAGAAYLVAKKRLHPDSVSPIEPTHPMENFAAAFFTPPMDQPWAVS